MLLRFRGVVQWRSKSGYQRVHKEEAEQLLSWVLLKTRKLQRWRIAWISVGILEVVRLQFGMVGLWVDK